MPSIPSLPLHLPTPPGSSSELALLRPKAWALLAAAPESTRQWKSRTKLQIPKLWMEDCAFQEVFELKVVI